jgi:hypothetical protein
MQNLCESVKRHIIMTFFANNRAKGKPYTVKHFVPMGIPRRTVYSVLRRCDNNTTEGRKEGSGGHNTIMTGRKLRTLRVLSLDKIGVSCRKLSRRLGVCKTTIQRHLVKIGAKYRARLKAPQYDESQRARAESRAKKLAVTLRDAVLIMDDEAYFCLKGDNTPGNDGFYTCDFANAPENVKFSTRKKFPTRLLVWLAISPKGVSAPFFLEAGNAVNSDVYCKHCIKERLVPFIQAYHPLDRIIFWPDLASAHYAVETQALLHNLNINFVPKQDNPPNLPQARPIENVWGMLKAIVYDKGWEAKSIRALKRKISLSIKKLDLDAIFRDLQSVPYKLRNIGRYGVYCSHH